MIDPNMGSLSSAPASTSLANALFPLVRQRVLALLYGNPGRSFFGNEVVALAQSGTGAVQRELASLAQAGLLVVTALGNQKHYQANAAAPVFEELRSLVLKTSGLVDVLRTALAPLAGAIDVAFVFGSVAKKQDTTHSDVDLLLVSDSLGYADAFSALEAAAARLGRKVNPTLYTRADLAKRVARKNAFALRVLAQDKLWVIGNQDTLDGLGA
ncbi:MAG: transcriptional regulator [Ramlibacter sp.]